MLKVDKKTLDRMEKDRPGIRQQILHFEKAKLPACSLCRSKDTADVQCGVIGRTINIAVATTKFKLIASGPTPGAYFCNTCGKFFKKKGERLSPGRKAQHTAKWARTMTKWLITFSRRSGVRWNVVDLGGKAKAESRGIVDLLAVRKDHRTERRGIKRGDLFEFVLIQTKGGSAPNPTPQDIARLERVAAYHRAKAIVLAVWHRGTKLQLYRLIRKRWNPVSASAVFG